MNWMKMNMEVGKKIGVVEKQRQSVVFIVRQDCDRNL